MLIRHSIDTDPEKLEKIARIVASGLAMEKIGQWSGSYPALDDFMSDHENRSLLVADKDGVVIGSITIQPENDPAYKELAWTGRNAYVVHRLMVLPEHRNKGVGKELFLSAIQKARDKGAGCVKVDTHPDNLRMQRLIESLEFARRGYMASINRIGYELKL